MAAPALLCLLLLLGTPGPGAGGGGAAHPARQLLAPPDTSKARALRPDTVRVAAPAALVPDAADPAAAADADGPLTRKSAIFTVAAMAVLTLTTLLLYNVRSR